MKFRNDLKLVENRYECLPIFIVQQIDIEYLSANLWFLSANMVMMSVRTY